MNARVRNVRLFTVTMVVAGPLGCSDPQRSAVHDSSARAVFDDWGDDAPGQRQHFTRQDLPPVTRDSVNEAKVAPRPKDTLPRVPAGFSVELLAEGLKSPRVVKAAPNGDLFIANSKANEIRVLHAPTASGRPAQSIYASGLKKPYGLAFYPAGDSPAWLYVADVQSIVRFPYHQGDRTASSPPEVLVEHLPGVHHWTHDIAFSPNGDRLFLSVGSGSNIALDMFPEPRDEGGLEAWKRQKPLGAAWDTEERRATILSFDPQGRDEITYATGLRNPSGIAFQPKTGALWAVINERDGLGDNTPFEYATRVRQGGFYGWPWYYADGVPDPRLKGARPDLAAKVEVPDVWIQAHTAPLQIVFYDGQSFPAEYRGDAFVTLHGSWNRETRTGYKVVRLRFDPSGKATGEYEDFMTGFVVSDREVWGRPVGVAVDRDGSLIVTEDGAGTVWRVSANSPTGR